ncbi:MAG: hypothetical protein ACQEP7_06880 [bacterium]
MKLPRLLNQAINNNRLAHAYLFYGRATGKYRPLVIKFFQNILCPEEGCNDCSDCRQIASLNHPDLVALEGNSNKIGVKTVREKIIKAAGLTPARGNRRLFWLNDIQRFTPEAANTLLKILEEPPDGTIFVLTARSRWDCLPTIRSRCQWVRFPVSLTPPEQPFKEVVENIWDNENYEQDVIDKWKKLIAGRANASQVNWSRASARGFLTFLIETIRRCYTDGKIDFEINEQFNLSWNLIPELTERLQELERGTQPILVINSIMEQLYYPKEQKEWLNVI